MLHTVETNLPPGVATKQYFVQYLLQTTSSTSTRYYDFFGRRPACTSYGLGTEETLLNINMLADEKKDDYCGVFINEKSEERSVAVAVIILKK